VNYAIHRAVVLEEVAKMAYYTEQVNNRVEKIQQSLMDKHFLRKHGSDAYYGQNCNEQQ